MWLFFRANSQNFMTNQTAVFRQCGLVNAYLCVFADTSFATIYEHEVHRSVNPHSRYSDKEYCADRRSILFR